MTEELGWPLQLHTATPWSLRCHSTSSCKHTSYQPQFSPPALPRPVLFYPLTQNSDKNHPKAKQEIAVKISKIKPKEILAQAIDKSINWSTPINSAGCGQTEQNGCCALKGPCTPVVFNSQGIIKQKIKVKSVVMQGAINDSLLGKNN